MFAGLIEEVGKVLWIRATDKGTQLQIAASHIAKKVRTGDSVAADGCCLTLNAHRGEQLTLDHARAGTLLNLEFDIVAKYVERMLSKSSQGATASQAFYI